MRWGVLFVQTATISLGDTVAMLPAPPDAGLFHNLMFVFGCAVTDDEIYRDCAEPGIRLAAEPDSRSSPSAAPGRSSATTTCSSTRPGPRRPRGAGPGPPGRGDRRPRLLREGARGAAGPRGRDRRLRRRDRRPQHRLVGGLGRPGLASPTSYDEVGGGEVPALTWHPDDVPVLRAARRRGRLARRIRAGLLPVGDARTCASTSRSASCTATTSTSACRRARPARRWSRGDIRVIHHHSLELISDPESWIEAHMRLAEKWDGPRARRRRRHRGLEAARPPCRGRGRGGPDGGVGGTS